MRMLLRCSEPQREVLRSLPPNPQASADAFHFTLFAGKRSSRRLSTSAPWQATRLVLQPKRRHNLPPFHTHPKLIPESLRATLDAHRDANRAFLVRKVDVTASDDLFLWRERRSDVGNAVRGVQEAEDPKGSLVPEPQAYPETKTLRFKPNVHEYKGVAQPLTEKWSIKAGPLETGNNPWMHLPPRVRMASPPFSAADALSQEIKNFEAYITPTREELAAAEVALEDLRDVVKRVDPALTATVIGSRANGLARPFSDIDVNLTTSDFPISEFQTKSPWTRKARNKAKKLLSEVHQALRPGTRNKRPRFTPEELVLRSRVPIALGHHVPSGLQYQVQCTTSAQQSLAYAKLYQKEFTTLRPIFLVIQQMLQMRGLTDGSKQGVGSYKILMMIVAALKLGQGKYNPHDVGSQLMHVLEFYSNFDFYETGMILEPPVLIQKASKSDTTSTQDGTSQDFESDDVAIQAARQMFATKERVEIPYLMILQDPANLLNNLGSNGHKIKHVQATISDAKEKLEASMRVWTTFKAKRVPAQSQISLLNPLVGGNYAAFQRVRSKLRVWGKNHRADSTIDPEKEL